MAHPFIKNIKFTPTLHDFYCTYTAAIGNPVGLADPTYQGELDVKAADAADAEAAVEKHLAAVHPGDRLLSCSCKEFA